MPPWPGSVSEEGENRGKSVIQRKSNPVGAGLKPDETAAVWRARRRSPIAVDPPVKGAFGRAWITTRSPWSSSKMSSRCSAASKPNGCRPQRGLFASYTKMPGAPSGLLLNGAPAGESRNSVMNLVVAFGSLSLPSILKTSTKGSVNGVILLIRSTGRR